LGQRCRNIGAPTSAALATRIPPRAAWRRRKTETHARVGLFSRGMLGFFSKRCWPGSYLSSDHSSAAGHARPPFSKREWSGRSSGLYCRWYIQGQRSRTRWQTCSHRTGTKSCWRIATGKDPQNLPPHEKGPPL